MATNVILPALGIAQETGKIVRWLKAEGEQVEQGEPVAEIETDKATVELEAPASGLLSNVTAMAGDEVPVGQVIAVILAPGEAPLQTGPSHSRGGGGRGGEEGELAPTGGREESEGGLDDRRAASIPASPLAARIAAEHNLDLSGIKPAGRRIQKADVLSHIQGTKETSEVGESQNPPASRLQPASPKARRLAAEQGKELAAIQGTGPEGAVLAADVLTAIPPATERRDRRIESAPTLRGPLPTPDVAGAPSADVPASAALEKESALSTTWRLMAERTTSSWTSVPHFYLVREVNASRLITWRDQLLKRSAEKVTYTDLLVKIVASALREHPRLNASWNAGRISIHEDVHIGLAVATEEGLVVPVMHRADTLGLGEIVERRKELLARAGAGKLRPEDIRGGTFTISNLGMYGVDAFNAIINPPQAAILAVGRIAQRVVPVQNSPSVQPMMVLSLGCDHRVVDGARGAQFLTTLAGLIEEPLGLLA